MMPGMISGVFMVLLGGSCALEQPAERRAEMMRRDLQHPSLNTREPKKVHVHLMENKPNPRVHTAPVLKSPRADVSGRTASSSATGVDSGVDVEPSAALDSKLATQDGVKASKGIVDSTADIKHGNQKPQKASEDSVEVDVDLQKDLEEEHRQLHEELEELKKFATAEDAGTDSKAGHLAPKVGNANMEAEVTVAKPALPSKHDADTQLEGQVVSSGIVRVADAAGMPTSPDRHADQHLQGRVSDTGRVQVSDAGATPHQHSGDKHYHVSDTGNVRVSSGETKKASREESGAHAKAKVASSAGAMPSSHQHDIDADSWTGQFRGENRDVQAVQQQQQQQQNQGSAAAVKLNGIPGNTILNSILAVNSATSPNVASTAICPTSQWVLSCSEVNGQPISAVYISQDGTQCSVVSQGSTVQALAQCSPSYTSTPMSTANMFASTLTTFSAGALNTLQPSSQAWATTCPAGMFPTMCLCSGSNCQSTYYWMPDSSGTCSQSGFGMAVTAICARAVNLPLIRVLVDTSGATQARPVSSVQCPSGLFVQSCSVLNNAPNNGVYIDTTGTICTALWPQDSNSNTVLGYTTIFAQALCGGAQVTTFASSGPTLYTSGATVTCPIPYFALECSCSIASNQGGQNAIVCPDANPNPNYFDPRFSPSSNGQCSLGALGSNPAASSSLQFQVNAICGKPSSLQLETGTASITTGNIRVPFRSPFTTAPVVIITPSSDGMSASQGTVQITSVSATGFVARVVGTGVGTRGNGPLSTMSVSYLAVFGTGRLGRAAQGPLITSGTANTTAFQRTSAQSSSCTTSSSQSLTPVNFANYVNPPALLTQLQSWNNPGAWGVAVSSLSSNGAQVALELGTSTASVAQADTIGWVAVEAVGGSFVDENGNNMFVTAYPSYAVNSYATEFPSSSMTTVDVSKTVGYPVVDGTEFFTATQPAVLSSLPWTVFGGKTSRNDQNGGILRLCSGTSSSVRLVSDISSAQPACSRQTDNASIVAFSGSTRVG